MMRRMRAMLSVLCSVTIAASCWLGAMFVVLHRTLYQRGVALSALFLLQSLLTLGVVAKVLASEWARAAAILGAASIIWFGGAAISRNLSGPHFEGYAVVIGAALVVQGILTIGLFASGSFALWAKVRQFGN